MKLRGRNWKPSDPSRSTDLIFATCVTACHLTHCRFFVDPNDEKKPQGTELLAPGRKEHTCMARTLSKFTKDVTKKSISTPSDMKAANLPKGSSSTPPISTRNWWWRSWTRPDCGRGAGRFPTPAARSPNRSSPGIQRRTAWGQRWWRTPGIAALLETEARRYMANETIMKLFPDRRTCVKRTRRRQYRGQSPLPRRQTKAPRRVSPSQHPWMWLLWRAICCKHTLSQTTSRSLGWLKQSKVLAATVRLMLRTSMFIASNSSPTCCCIWRRGSRGSVNWGTCTHKENQTTRSKLKAIRSKSTKCVTACHLTHCRFFFDPNDYKKPQGTELLAPCRKEHTCMARTLSKFTKDVTKKSISTPSDMKAANLPKGSSSTPRSSTRNWWWRPWTQPDCGRGAGRLPTPAARPPNRSPPGIRRRTAWGHRWWRTPGIAVLLEEEARRHMAGETIMMLFPDRRACVKRTRRR